ncbi:hypothetical protein GUJ93_ZPchr0012g20804 [Zizania palustris]|uniref:RING-type E3 ubiquitin transferase n=1 Tax=Zizania palustris TaxID=103762 RepID=A0A8J5WV75_ZIZPA|nr:hypothetical protein GUJ93_ZPchr0012g20804 [Zizania palustris]
MKTHEAQGKKRWKVVKEADDEYSDREWEDVEVVVEKEVVKWMVVVKNKEERMMTRMGAWVPVGQLAEQEVIAYMQLEEGKISKALDDLLDICKSQKVNASKIIVSCDNTARGLLQLVDDHGISDLVMGASSHRGYTRLTE